MKQRKIERLLQKESNLVLRGIKQEIKQVHFPKANTPKKTKRFATWTFGLATAFALLVAFVIVPFTQATTILAFSVNPEVQMTLNYKEKVISVQGLNKDGVILIYDESFSGLTMEEGIDKLMGLYEEMGYFDSNPTIRLLSYHRNKSKEETLLQKGFDRVQSYLNQHAHTATVERSNQAERATSFLSRVMLEEGFTAADLKGKSIKELIKMRAHYDEDIIQGILAQLQAYRQSIQDLPNGQRQEAMSNMKKNRLGRP